LSPWLHAGAGSLKAADVGKKITVKMTALAWGRLPRTLTSAPVTPTG